MKKIIYDSEYFNILDTLECGQVFRFIPYKQGFRVHSLDKCAYCYTVENKTIIECEDKDYDYFYNYFDLDRDYSKIHRSAIDFGVRILTTSASLGKGIRILNQDPFETTISFLISQNNNIPRIKSLIEKLCVNLGEKKQFLGEEYYAFPSLEKLKTQTVEFYKNLGFGYRANYLLNTVEFLQNHLDILSLKSLSTTDLKSVLLSVNGIGPKVADCITFFGFRKTDSFPVDTWIEKIYREDFNGELKSRQKMAEYFVEKFGFNAGYFQQYLFYYKRSKENK
jgi:N-glycosylase/DNA lyase